MTIGSFSVTSAYLATDVLPSNVEVGFRMYDVTGTGTLKLDNFQVTVVPEPALTAWKEMADWMRHSRESVIGAHAGPWPEAVNAPVTLREQTAYIHFLPDFPGEVRWTNAPKVIEARLLRTKDAIPLRYVGNALHLTVPAGLRTTNVDVVALKLEP